MNLTFKPKSYCAFLLLLVMYKFTGARTGEKHMQAIPYRIRRFMVNALLHISKDHRYVLQKLVKYLDFTPAEPDTDLPQTEIHSTIGTASLVLYGMMIWSFLESAKVNVRIFAHDDGTLTPGDLDWIKRKLPYVQVVRHTRALGEIRGEISKFPLLNHHRQSGDNYFLLMCMIDIPLLTKSKRVMFFDSDLLFFKKPSELITWGQSLNSNKLLFLSDYHSVYVFTNGQTRKHFGVNPIPSFNSGLVCYWRKTVTLEEIESFFHALVTYGLDYKTHRDQTFWMLHARKHYPEAERLPRTYHMSEHPEISPDTVCCHYVTPVRNLFFAQAIRLAFKVS